MRRVLLRSLLLCCLPLCAPLSALAAPAKPAHPFLYERTAMLPTRTGTLYGALLVPRTPRPLPAVLLVPGSGPTDRDGNFPQLKGVNNSLKLLAEALARAGVASLRYDRRGIAASAAALPDESALRVEAYADDAAGWVRQLRRDRRFSRIVVVGYSEGLLPAMLATRQAKADAFVALAGPARAADDVLREQLRGKLEPGAAEELEATLQALREGRAAPVQSPALALLLRPSIQPYLMSQLRYNPADVFGTLTMPVLIAQGTSDVQVSSGDAMALQGARPDAKLVAVDGMNHIFKMVGAEKSLQMQSYSRPDLPVSTELVGALADFARAPRR
ncbi:MAG TPA: alpha/beta hydrolase [Burkholderiaceae bacterium]